MIDIHPTLTETQRTNASGQLISGQLILFDSKHVSFVYTISIWIKKVWDDGNSCISRYGDKTVNQKQEAWRAVRVQ